MEKNSLKIVNYNSHNAHFFKEINEEWISDMFRLEAKDRKVLENAQELIIDNGGHILFVEAAGLGIIGAGALLRTAPDEFELTKMGVFKKARGLKAGEFLLQALIEKAKQIKATKLYLLTNKTCESAIHLYEKNGFVHDNRIMCDYGSEYQRCDVAMNYKLGL